MMASKYVSIPVSSLHGRHVSTIEDVKDALRLWEYCDYDALKIARAHIGRQLGRVCVELYVSGGGLYARCAARRRGDRFSNPYKADTVSRRVSAFNKV